MKDLNARWDEIVFLTFFSSPTIGSATKTTCTYNSPPILLIARFRYGSMLCKGCERRMCISVCLLKIKIIANLMTFFLILRLLLVCLMWN